MNCKHFHDNEAKLGKRVTYLKKLDQAHPTKADMKKTFKEFQSNPETQISTNGHVALKLHVVNHMMVVADLQLPKNSPALSYSEN